MKLIKSEKLYSISQLAALFYLSRTTVRQRIQDIPPADVQGTSRLWAIPSVSLVLSPIPDNYFQDKDPNELSPTDRNLWFNSEQRRIQLMVASGELLPVSQVEEGLAEIFKALQLTIATLPDIMERDARLTPDQVNKAIPVCDDYLQKCNAALKGLEFNHDSEG